MVGRSGRGPTMFISPRSTLSSWGSSSSRYWRSTRPSGVTRGSCCWAQTAPLLALGVDPHRAELVDGERAGRRGRGCGGGCAGPGAGQRGGRARPAPGGRTPARARSASPAPPAATNTGSSASKRERREQHVHAAMQPLRGSRPASGLTRDDRPRIRARPGGRERSPRRAGCRHSAAGELLKWQYPMSVVGSGLG